MSLTAEEVKEDTYALTGARKRPRAVQRQLDARRGAARRREEGAAIAKMASHAIFQYNVLAIDDTHNTWTNVIIKMTILRLLGSSDDKENTGVPLPG